MSSDKRVEDMVESGKTESSNGLNEEFVTVEISSAEVTCQRLKEYLEKKYPGRYDVEVRKAT